MLVLGRKKRQSVVIGDEITLTVEEICHSDDGQRIFGATVRLGFQMPRYVSVCRSELRDRQSGDPSLVGARRRPRRQEGECVPLSDVLVRLRLRVPDKVPVRHNGAPTAGCDGQDSSAGQPEGPYKVYHVTCRKEDRIAICNNITIAALDFHRFVASQGERRSEPPEVAAAATAE